VTFDPAIVSYDDLVNAFFAYHDPSPWAGSQYRSAIFVHTAEQRAIATAAVSSKGALGKMAPIEEARDFYKGEEYHQKYLDKMMGL